MSKPLNLDPTQRIEVVPPVAVRLVSHPDKEVVLELFPYPTYHLTVTQLSPEHGLVSHQIQLSKDAYRQLLAEMEEPDE